MNKDSNSEKHRVHRPEYVILESEDNLRSEQEGSQEAFQAIKEVGTRNYTLSVRLFSLFSLSIVVILSCFLLLYLIFAAAAASLAFFQNVTLNNLFKGSWGMFKNALAVILGLTVSIFSPSFGFSIIMLYTILHQNEYASSYFKYFFKPPV